LTDYERIVERLTLPEADYKLSSAFSLEEKQSLLNLSSDLYNAFGELSVDAYIESTRELDELMVDGIDPGGIETEVLHDPYMLRIFIPEYPPHLQQYTKTKFSRRLGYGMVTGRWYRYMSVALLKLRQKGSVPFTEKVVVIYKYHFPKDKMDADNYAQKTINDALRDARIVKDDSHKYVTVVTQGVTDKEKYGIEIIVLSESDFCSHYIEENRPL